VGLLDGQASSIAMATTAAASAAPAPDIQRDDGRFFTGGTVISESGDASAKRATSRSIWVANFPENASTHCVPEINSWGARRLDILDADGNDRLLLADRPLKFARHEVQLVARARQNENERRRRLDAAYDLIAVGCAELHVAWRDPAF
jgi:hypothetical protein